MNCIILLALLFCCGNHSCGCTHTDCCRENTNCGHTHSGCGTGTGCGINTGCGCTNNKRPEPRPEPRPFIPYPGNTCGCEGPSENNGCDCCQ